MNLLPFISAHSYPKANLSRATNFESKEMLQYVSLYTSEDTVNENVMCEKISFSPIFHQNYQ